MCATNPAPGQSDAAGATCSPGELFSAPNVGRRPAGAKSSNQGLSSQICPSGHLLMANKAATLLSPTVIDGGGPNRPEESHFPINPTTDRWEGARMTGGGGSPAFLPDGPCLFAICRVCRRAGLLVSAVGPTAAAADLSAGRLERAAKSLLRQPNRPNARQLYMIFLVTLCCNWP